MKSIPSASVWLGKHHIAFPCEGSECLLTVPYKWFFSPTTKNTVDQKRDCNFALAFSVGLSFLMTIHASLSRVMTALLSRTMRSLMAKAIEGRLGSMDELVQVPRHNIHSLEDTTDSVSGLDAILESCDFQ